MGQGRQSSALAIRTLQGWAALSGLGLALGLAAMAGLFGAQGRLAVAWIIVGWSLHTLRLVYVWWVPNAPERLWTTTTLALAWAGLMASMMPQGGWLMLAVLTPFVWRASQRYGGAIGLRVAAAALLSVAVGVLGFGGPSGAPLDWASAASLVFSLSLVAMVWGYGRHAHAMLDERNRLRHTVSRQRVNARAQRYVDPETGLSNRRGVAHELAKLHARRARHQLPYGALLLRASDIQPGDIAAVLEAQSRGYDTVGRVGSQDYVWVIANLEPGMPERLIRRLNLALRPHAIEIGVAEADDTQDAEALLSRAMDNLSSVKAA